MRIKRGKHYKRILNFYAVNFDFKPPYNVLLDGNFIQKCVKVQFDVKEMLMKLLFAPVHINIRFSA
jgi:U3 small nucleolar RNA-associated protein 23